MWPNSNETTYLVTFTEEILNGKLHCLCSEPRTGLAMLSGSAKEVLQATPYLNISEKSQEDNTAKFILGKISGQSVSWQQKAPTAILIWESIKTFRTTSL